MMKMFFYHLSLHVKRLHVSVCTLQGGMFLVISQVFCAKVVDAISSEGLSYDLADWWPRSGCLLSLQYQLCHWPPLHISKL